MLTPSLLKADPRVMLAGGTGGEAALSVTPDLGCEDVMSCVISPGLLGLKR